MRGKKASNAVDNGIKNVAARNLVVEEEIGRLAKRNHASARIVIAVNFRASIAQWQSNRFVRG